MRHIPPRFIKWVGAGNNCNNPPVKRQLEQISLGCLPWYIVQLDEKVCIYIGKEFNHIKRVNIEKFTPADCLKLLTDIHR